MKFRYQILADHRAIVARYSGVFTFADLAATAELLWADPRYSRDFDGLVDISQASAGIAIADFRAFLKFIREQPTVSRGRWAVVATSPFATACGLMYQTAMTGRHPINVFSSWEAATAFLALSLPPDLPMVDGYPDSAAS